MKAMIFAAGLGTRLRPITDTIPKALVPVGGKPLLEHVIERLHSCGFDEFVVNVHHFASKISDFLDHADFQGCRIRVSDETDLLRDTGGGIRHARALLDDGKPFLVHNVDIITDLDPGKVYRAHDPASLATLVVSERKSSRYLLFENRNVADRPCRRLVGWMNVSTGEVRSPYGEWRRQPSGDFDADSFVQANGLEKFAFAGIHVISPGVFPLMESWPEKFSIIDFYLSVAAEHTISAYVADHATIVDVGKMETLEKAEELVRIAGF